LAAACHAFAFRFPQAGTREEPSIDRMQTDAGATPTVPTKPEVKPPAAAALKSPWSFLDGKGVPPPKPKKTRTAAQCASAEAERENSMLPIINDINEIFVDLLRKTPEIADVLARLNRPLRVATMCSGTESPLLALEMMRRAVDKLYGAKLRVEHVFSCEIEPFKQVIPTYTEPRWDGRRSTRARVSRPMTTSEPP
jgi:hypothetical protein